MEHDTAGLRAALPARLRDAWDRIATIDAGLAAALAGETQADVAELGAERTRCIEAFFVAFPLEARTAGLRSMALQHLLAVNDTLAAAARRELATASAVATAARHQRKAISAYQEHIPQA
jgi:hypothetical protein